MARTLPGFALNEEPIFVGRNSVILSAIKEVTQRRVILKFLSTKLPSPDQIRKFKHEYEITRRFDTSSGIIHCYDFI